MLSIALEFEKDTSFYLDMTDNVKPITDQSSLSREKAHAYRLENLGKFSDMRCPEIFYHMNANA